jgi:hypothetical protein
MNGGAAQPIFIFFFYGSLGAITAFVGIRLLLNSGTIAKKKAVKQGTVSPLYYKASRLFGQTEEDLDRIQSVTKMQGISWLIVSAFFWYLGVGVLIHSIFK